MVRSYTATVQLSKPGDGTSWRSSGYESEFPLQGAKLQSLAAQRSQKNNKPRRLTLVNTMNEAKDFINFTSVPLMPLF